MTRVDIERALNAVHFAEHQGDEGAATQARADLAKLVNAKGDSDLVAKAWARIRDLDGAA